MTRRRHVYAAMAALLVTMSVAVSAHELTVRGTVSAVEPTRIRIKTGDEKADQSPTWYPIDAKTKIKRGTKTVTFAEAKITIDERVVAIVDHPTQGPMTTKEIRLAAPASGGGGDAR